MNNHYHFLTPGIMIYRESLATLDMLRPEELKEVMSAINRMMVLGELEPDFFPGNLNGMYVFECIKKRAIEANEKYKETIRKRSEIGTIGAKKRWNS